MRVRVNVVTMYEEATIITRDIELPGLPRHGDVIYVDAGEAQMKLYVRRAEWTEGDEVVAINAAAEP